MNKAILADMGLTNTRSITLDIWYALDACSLGLLLVASSEKGVSCIIFGDNEDELTAELERRYPNANLIVANDDYAKTVDAVINFVESPASGFDFPLDIHGTPFQQRVWQALADIPPALTASYADIAESIGSPKAFRAVAQACAANPIAVAIPCHRAVRSDGTLSGYRWGIERKRELLKRESSSSPS